MPEKVKLKDNTGAQVYPEIDPADKGGGSSLLEPFKCSIQEAFEDDEKIEPYEFEHIFSVWREDITIEDLGESTKQYLGRVYFYFKINYTDQSGQIQSADQLFNAFGDFYLSHELTDYSLVDLSYHFINQAISGAVHVSVEYLMDPETGDVQITYNGITVDEGIELVESACYILPLPTQFASWYPWSAKQDTLYSGSNIKTINGNSILGWGDLVIQAGVTSVNNQTGAVTVQPTLVSGTNIKTINTQSILGSGDLTIQAGVTSVNNQTGAVTLGKSDVGLGNADNTADLDKPVSTATQEALDQKQATLVSGTNIKTLNNQSILGSGDLVLTTPGVQFTSVAPSAPNLDGDLKFVVLDAEPATKYSGYIYYITQANSQNSGE